MLNGGKEPNDLVGCLTDAPPRSPAVCYACHVRWGSHCFGALQDIADPHHAFGRNDEHLAVADAPFGAGARHRANAIHRAFDKIVVDQDLQLDLRSRLVLYSWPRYMAVRPRCWPKPCASQTVIRVTPTFVRASRRASSLVGWMMAMMSFTR